MSRGHYGPKAWWRGAGPAKPAVGISLFHTVGDRDRAVEQTNTEFKTLVSELIVRMGLDPSLFVVDPSKFTGPQARDHIAKVSAARQKMEASPLYPFWISVVAPLYDEWNQFYTDQSAWEEWTTNWETYEKWMERLNALRESTAKVFEATGQSPLGSPTPVDLPKTLPGTVIDATGAAVKRVAQGVAGGAGDVWTFVKIGAVGALALGGVYLVTSIVHSVRKGNDPAERLVDMYGRVRPARAW